MTDCEVHVLNQRYHLGIPYGNQSLRWALVNTDKTLVETQWRRRTWSEHGVQWAIVWVTRKHFDPEKHNRPRKMREDPFHVVPDDGQLPLLEVEEPDGYVDSVPRRPRQYKRTAS